MTCPSCGGVNPEGMRFCGLCGRSLQANEARRERRRVSIVFVDLASFSLHTHNADPEVLRDLADEVLTVVASVIEDYDGHVDAFRGDGLVALFGAPHSHPDDPQRAVLAAATSLRAIQHIGAARGMPLQGRAGVNTGVVIAGSLGPGRVRDYTVMGSAVNLAARLEAAAEPGSVWVGPDTFDEVHHRLRFERTERVELDGFPEIEHAYRLLSTREARSADPYAHLRFVGRARELTFLRRKRDQTARAGRGRQLWLGGDAGSGKSRLLLEAFGPGGRRDNDLVLWLRLPTDEGDPWTQLARQLFDLHEGEDLQAAQRRVGHELTRLLPDEPRWHQSLLASLHLIEQRPYRRLDRRQVDRASLAWRDLLVALTRRPDGPEAVVLILDDAPLEPGVEDFLRLLVEAHAPLLIIRSNRGRGTKRQADALRLDPLPAEDATALLEQLVPADLQPAAAALAEQISHVPGHLIELGRAVAANGPPAPDTGESGSVSTALAALLQATLDQLDPGPRHLLAKAAVAGESVWDGLLEELHGDPPDEDLDVLIRQDLLAEVPGSWVPGEHEYRFTSELMRGAALRLVPFDERPSLHLRMASWLEQNAPLSLAETVAGHFERGGAPEAAYVHYLIAADHLQEAGRSDRAEALFGHLLALPVDEDLLAQAAINWSQSALSELRADAALDRLARAAAWIGRNRHETDPRLRDIEARLTREVASLRASQDEPARDVEARGTSSDVEETLD